MNDDDVANFKRIALAKQKSALWLVSHRNFLRKEVLRFFEFQTKDLAKIFC